MFSPTFCISLVFKDFTRLFDLSPYRSPSWVVVYCQVQILKPLECGLGSNPHVCSSELNPEFYTQLNYLTFLSFFLFIISPTLLALRDPFLLFCLESHGFCFSALPHISHNWACFWDQAGRGKREKKAMGLCLHFWDHSSSGKRERFSFLWVSDACLASASVMRLPRGQGEWEWSCSMKKIQGSSPPCSMTCRNFFSCFLDQKQKLSLVAMFVLFTPGT